MESENLGINEYLQNIDSKCGLIGGSDRETAELRFWFKQIRKGIASRLVRKNWQLK